MTTQTLLEEKRRKFRFQMERELRYKLLAEATVVTTGAGCTVDISSNGIAFLGQHKLEPGTLVELSISWPVLLGEACAMRLIVFGRIVRSEGFRSACTIDKYEFRTQARTVRETPIPIRNDGALRRWAETLKTKEMVARATA